MEPTQHPYSYDLAFPEGAPLRREATNSAGAMPTKLQDMLDAIMAKVA